MLSARTSSRRRFADYLAKLQRDRKLPSVDEPHKPGAPPRRSHRSAWVLIRSFWDLMIGQRTAAIFSLATVTISTLLGLLPPAATKFIIDYVIGEKTLSSSWLERFPQFADRQTLLTVVLAGVVLVGLIRSGIHLWGRWVATRATKQLQTAIRRRVFDHAVRLPLHRSQELKSGGTTSLLREDGGSVGELMFGLLYNPWRAIVQLVGSLCILAWVDWRLLVGGLAVLPLVYLTHRTWISGIRPQHRAIRQTRQDIDAQTTETFGGMRVVRAFGRQRSESSRFLRGTQLMVRQELRSWWSMRVIEMLWDLMIPIASAALLWYGGRQVLAGQLSLGDVMMFLVYVLMLLEPSPCWRKALPACKQASPDSTACSIFSPSRAEMPNAPDAVLIRKDQVQGKLSFEHVSFHYPGNDRPVLQNVTLDVPAGQTFALVGHSGAGKTTLCNLAARFYDPTAGRVLLDGRDIRQIDVESFRGLLGIVEQDVFLFDGTVAENIGYGRRDVDRDEIRRVAEIAYADEFISRLPQGYDTIIGERGVKLSGGQRQRLAIARALLADPKILILDEATSNLDTESEQLIQAGLHQLMEGRTCFVIAHRLSTIRHADQIVVMEDGHVREIGTHDELLATDGRYREMVELRKAGRYGAAPPPHHSRLPHTCGINSRRCLRPVTRSVYAESDNTGSAGP
ncbi:MAG: ABC transporter ATP-binding protein [Planctomycetaceae bacterium]